MTFRSPQAGLQPWPPGEEIRALLRKGESFHTEAAQHLVQLLEGQHDAVEKLDPFLDPEIPRQRWWSEVATAMRDQGVTEVRAWSSLVETIHGEDHPAARRSVMPIIASALRTLHVADTHLWADVFGLYEPTHTADDHSWPRSAEAMSDVGVTCGFTWRRVVQKMADGVKKGHVGETALVALMKLAMPHLSNRDEHERVEIGLVLSLLSAEIVTPRVWVPLANDQPHEFASLLHFVEGSACRARGTAYSSFTVTLEPLKSGQPIRNLLPDTAVEWSAEVEAGVQRQQPVIKALLAQSTRLNPAAFSVMAVLLSWHRGGTADYEALLAQAPLGWAASVQPLWLRLLADQVRNVAAPTALMTSRFLEDNWNDEGVLGMRRMVTFIDDDPLLASRLSSLRCEAQRRIDGAANFDPRRLSGRSVEDCLLYAHCILQPHHIVPIIIHVRDQGAPMDVVLDLCEKGLRSWPASDANAPLGSLVPVLVDARTPRADALLAEVLKRVNALSPQQVTGFITTHQLLLARYPRGLTPASKVLDDMCRRMMKAVADVNFDKIPPKHFNAVFVMCIAVQSRCAALRHDAELTLAEVDVLQRNDALLTNQLRRHLPHMDADTLVQMMLMLSRQSAHGLLNELWLYARQRQPPFSTTDLGRIQALVAPAAGPH